MDKKVVKYKSNLKSESKSDEMENWELCALLEENNTFFCHGCESQSWDDLQETLLKQLGAIDGKNDALHSISSNCSVLKSEFF